MLDDEGYLSIVGRIKDTIIRGGENIAPREIEDVLFTHPLIENASVVAVPDERFGDEVNISVSQNTQDDAECYLGSFWQY